MIDHIAFVVEDPEATAKMLANFGYEVCRRTAHHCGSVEVESKAQPGLILELCTKRPRDVKGVNHICMRLEDQDEFAKIEAAGISFSGAPHLSPESGRYVTNHVDADGIKWQITF